MSRVYAFHRNALCKQYTVFIYELWWLMPRVRATNHCEAVERQHFYKIGRSVGASNDRKNYIYCSRSHRNASCKEIKIPPYCVIISQKKYEARTPIVNVNRGNACKQGADCWTERPRKSGAGSNHRCILLICWCQKRSRPFSFFSALIAFTVGGIWWAIGWSYFHNNVLSILPFVLSAFVIVIAFAATALFYSAKAALLNPPDNLRTARVQRSLRYSLKI